MLRNIFDLLDGIPICIRLFEIIDHNRDGRMIADELQKALELPAHAQSISRLVIHCENEWHWIPQKWNEMDEILGHSPSTPHTNWFSENSRIEQMCWWSEVAAKVGLPVDGRVWHFHPVGIAVSFAQQKKSWAQSTFAQLLGKVESKNDYTAYNRTTPPPLKSFYNTDLTKPTLQEVQQKHSSREFFAIGRYQLIPETLNSAIKHLKLDLDTKFDEETQDRIFEDYLIKVKRKSIIEYLEGNGSIEDAIYAWAMEFASAGVRRGKRISPFKLRDENGNIVHDENGHPIWIQRTATLEGESYYSGDGLNQAHILPDDMIKVLEDSKKNGS